MWRLWIIIPIALALVAVAGPPMPPAATTTLRSPKDAQTFVGKTSAAVPIDPQVRVTIVFDVQTVSTNYPPIYLGLVANPDLNTTNWRVVWTGEYPRSTNNYAITNWPGSWYTSNYWVTVRVTLTNQPANADNYRVFYHDDL